MNDAEKVEFLRSQLPALGNGIYLNNGWAGPIAEVTQQAMREVYEREFERGRVGSWASEARLEEANKARAAVAALLQAELDEVGLTFSATDAMNVVLWGLDWRPGDEIVTTNLENSAALVPLYILAERRGVKLRFVDLHYGEVDAAAALGDAITANTRLVLISDITYCTGAVLDVQAVARLAHAANVLVLVDGAQSGGAMPLSLHDLEVDFYALSGHKWLGGPEGTGALYVRRGAQGRLQMSTGGVYSDVEHGLGGSLKPFPGARRHEVSTRNYAALAGQSASIRWMLEQVGIGWAYERSRSLCEYARKLFSSIPGVEVLTPLNHAGLFAFRTQQPVQDLYQALDAQGIWCRYVDQPALVRLSIGYYTLQREIEQVVQTVEAGVCV